MGDHLSEMAILKTRMPRPHIDITAVSARITFFFRAVPVPFTDCGSLPTIFPPALMVIAAWRGLDCLRAGALIALAANGFVGKFLPLALVASSRDFLAGAAGSIAHADCTTAVGAGNA